MKRAVPLLTLILTTAGTLTSSALIAIPTSPTKAAPTKAPILKPVTDEQASLGITAASLVYLKEFADRHFDKGEYNHCISLNQVVLQGEPHEMDLYSDDAWLLWSTDRTPMAIATLKQGLDANKTTYYMYDELGQFYWLHLHKPYIALAYYKEAVKFPAPMVTWHGLAHCYEQSGDLKDAVKAWQHCCTIKGDAVAPIELGRVEVKLAEQERQARDKKKV